MTVHKLWVILDQPQGSRLTKALLDSSAITSFLKVWRKVAWHTSSGRLFHRDGATTKKTHFLVDILLASFGMTILQ